MARIDVLVSLLLGLSAAAGVFFIEIWLGIHALLTGADAG